VSAEAGHQSHQSRQSHQPRRLRRWLLWGVLVAALLAVAGAALLQRLQSAPPLPVYSEVPDFRLTNRDGRTVTRADLAGAPWIADFVFTRCPASCPLMTARLARFERELPRGLGVRLVSISVDPEHDTPQVLQAYAARHGAPARWLFLTGPREAIFWLSREGFKLGIGEPPPAAPPSPDAPAAPPIAPVEPILHSNRFVLVDGQARIRGYYDAFDEEAMARLRRDLESLR
jgi:protein SCO1